ncbi:MAG: hypothetical protein CMJ67_08970 [Planctomycetaceae bacterium]|nr:hypothetical protein [Planctomycetaceae bacterium]
MNQDHFSSDNHSNTDPSAGSSSAPETPREGGDVLSLIADVEHHLERIREVQNRQTTDFADLAERQRRVSDAEAALAQRGSELEATAAELASAREAMENQRGELEGRNAELEERRARLEEAERGIDGLRSELEGVRAELDADRARIAERSQELDGRFGEVDRRSSELESREHELVERIAAAEASAAGVQTEMDQMASEHESRMAEAERAREAHAARESEFRGRCEQLESELVEFRTLSDDSREAIGRMTEELESARNDLQAARSELEQANGRIAETEGRCGELEAAANTRESEFTETEARATGLQNALDESNRRLAELEARILEDERQIGLAGGKLAELAHVIAEQAPRLEQGAEAMALLPELEARIRELQAEVGQNSGADGELVAFREKAMVRIDQLERDLEIANAKVAEAPTEVDADRIDALLAEARAPLEQRILDLESGVDESGDGEVVSREKYETVKNRCQKAERRGDELETALSMANDRGQAQEMAKRLRAKAERVGDYARHLDLRKKRLAGMRTAISRQRVAEVAMPEGSSFHELQRLEAQRKELEQVRDFLGRSEQQMVRRWARPRSVAMVAWMFVLLAVSAAAGWFGVNDFVPTPGAAVVKITAVAPDGKMLLGEKEAAWDKWHKALATDPAFIAMVHQKLAARGLADGGESATARMMAEDLVFEDEGNGQMRLLLTGDDSRVLEPTLDVIATSLASESARQSPRRKDGARATLPNERVTSSGVGYAALVKGPYDSETLGWMGMIAGGVFAASVLLIGIVYGFLSRAKRVFEERESIEEASV